MAKGSGKKKHPQNKPQTGKARAKSHAKPPARHSSKQSQQNRTKILGIIAGITVVVLATIIAVTIIRNRAPYEPPPVTGGEDIASLLQGIPQQNNALGDPKAPVTMIEFADLKCPVCARFSGSTLTQIINDYVRPGKLRIVFDVQTFVNQAKTPGDSERGARFALAAGQQNMLWNFAELHYKNQPPEEEKYFTDQYLTDLGNNIPGLNVQQAFGATNSDDVTKQINDFQQSFRTSGFTGVPSFQVGKTGGQLTNITAQSLDYSVFKNAIDPLL